jgi:L-2,4-diaminobutyrate decarboxylase
MSGSVNASSSSANLPEDDEMNPDDFQPNEQLLLRAVALLTGSVMAEPSERLPTSLPETGIGPVAALSGMFDDVLGRSRDLGAPGFFAHMDPPTPPITWAMHLWMASRNQNLLHPDTAPRARELERLAVDWIAPWFGMSGGHMTPGSTVANLTAIWAARERGCRAVVSGAGAHLSIRKAAHLLGMEHRVVDDWSTAGDLENAVAVITAGTTSSGEIEPLDAARDARWRHVDAAWSGPLRLSDRHRHLLDGIETADSVAISAHKWLFQPKESAFVLFADHEAAHRSISIDGAYLAVPNVGIQGSHGAIAAPLVAMLLAYGREGVAGMIDRTMELVAELAELVDAHDDLESRSAPSSGVLCWRHKSVSVEGIKRHLPDDVMVSSTTIDGEPWLRSVAANPNADPATVVAGVVQAAALHNS